MNQSLVALYHLQEVDTAILQTDRMLRRLDTGANEKALADELRASRDAAAERLHRLERDLHDSELEQRSVEAKRKEYETKLYSGKVSNPKELDAMQHEIEALGRYRGTLDERILGLMDELESARALAGETELRFAEADRQYQEKARHHQANSLKLQGDLAKLQLMRKHRAADVPAPLVKRYEVIRAAKGGAGAALLEAGRCGACRTNLPRNIVVSVRDTEAIETCESCGRILCPQTDGPKA